MSAPELKRLGRRLRRVLYEEETFALVEHAGTWMAGGCWILAGALRSLFGSEAELRMVTSPEGPQHVVAFFGGLYWDADGAASEKQLLRKMRTLERVREPRVIDLDAAALRRGEVPEPDWRSVRLAGLLRERLDTRGALRGGE